MRTRSGRISRGKGSTSRGSRNGRWTARSEEHTSELQSPCNLVCRLLLEKNTRDFSARGLHRISNNVSIYFLASTNEPGASQYVAMHLHCSGALVVYVTAGTAPASIHLCH